MKKCFEQLFESKQLGFRAPGEIFFPRNWSSGNPNANPNSRKRDKKIMAVIDVETEPSLEKQDQLPSSFILCPKYHFFSSFILFLTVYLIETTTSSSTSSSSSFPSPS
jgi:hypothetical protein